MMNAAQIFLTKAKAFAVFPTEDTLYSSPESVFASPLVVKPQAYPSTPVLKHLYL